MKRWRAFAAEANRSRGARAVNQHRLSATPDFCAFGSYTPPTNRMLQPNLHPPVIKDRKYRRYSPC